jgi:hypothetical protein
MYVEDATGQHLSRTQSAQLNANQVADEQGTGYWTARHRPAPQARRPARPTGPTATRAAKGLPMTRVLPHLDTADWPETDQPVDALIGDELAAQYGGWPQS